MRFRSALSFGIHGVKKISLVRRVVRALAIQTPRESFIRDKCFLVEIHSRVPIEDSPLFPLHFYRMKLHRINSRDYRALVKLCAKHIGSSLASTDAGTRDRSFRF